MKATKDGGKSLIGVRIDRENRGLLLIRPERGSEAPVELWRKFVSKGQHSVVVNVIDIRPERAKALMMNL